jgi:enoyl-CoA hydratase/carnithine racemase
MPSTHFEAAGGIAVIVIDRPHRRNAIDRATAHEIADALAELETRADLSVGIITGAGGFFSADMDLKAFSETGERPLVEGRGAFGLCERPPDKPLIAAVDEPAVGGGFEIALACDCIVASEDASFGLPEVTRGLVAAGGGLLYPADRVARNVAMELVMTGDTIGAACAFELAWSTAWRRQGKRWGSRARSPLGLPAMRRWLSGSRDAS